jgi:acyl-CoA dehydrogenase
MYRAPVEEIAHTLKSVAGLRKALDAGRFGDLGEDLVDAILTEAGRFASDEVAPLNEIGDTHGAVLRDGEVAMPPGWKDLYQNWIAGGWNSLTGSEDYGGQGLPTLLSVAALEMWNSGSLAFGIGPTLTMGAVEALEKHATDDLKANLSRKARHRRMDGHDEPDRAAGRLRSQCAQGARRTGRRRHLPHLRPEDLHYLWRA